MSELSASFPLPPRFRAGDMLAFHGRDAQQVAERVEGRSLQKGMMWGGRPACLSVRFSARTAHAGLASEGRAPAGSEARFRAMVRRMLGLDQDIGAFERRFRHHPQFGIVIARQTGLRVPVSATPFEALSWSVAAQQISVKAAIALRRNLIRAANIQHPAGLYCYPEAREVAGLGEADLRQAGFSAAKARTLLALAGLVLERQLPLDAWLDAPPVAEIEARLLAVRGVGAWTLNYTLLRGFGWLDGSLHGDVAVRRGIQLLLRLPDPVGAEEAQAWLAQFSPWRALAAAHLWMAQAARPA